VFRTPLGDEVYTQFLEGWNEHVDAVEAVLKNAGSAWFRDKPRDACVSRPSRAPCAASSASARRDAGLGLGKLHTLTLRHAFHAKTALRKLVDVGPVPTPGSGTTVNNGQWIAAHPFGQLAGAGFRHVADLATSGRLALRDPGRRERQPRLAAPRRPLQALARGARGAHAHGALGRRARDEGARAARARGGLTRATRPRRGAAGRAPEHVGREAERREGAERAKLRFASRSMSRAPLSASWSISLV